MFFSFQKEEVLVKLGEYDFNVASETLDETRNVADVIMHAQVMDILLLGSYTRLSCTLIK